MNKQQKCPNWTVSGSLSAVVSTTVHPVTICNLPLIFVPGSTNTRPEQPSFETAVDTISDLLTVRRVRKSWLAATSQNHFEC